MYNLLTKTSPALLILTALVFGMLGITSIARADDGTMHHGNWDSNKNGCGEWHWGWDGSQMSWHQDDCDFKHGDWSWKWNKRNHGDWNNDWDHRDKDWDQTWKKDWDRKDNHEGWGKKNWDWDKNGHHDEDWNKDGRDGWNKQSTVGVRAHVSIW